MCSSGGISSTSSRAQPFPSPGDTNVMPDLANAMKHNPNLKVMVNGGYYDLATPYYEGWYEMHHLPIPPAAREATSISLLLSRATWCMRTRQSLKELHDAVAAFIRQTDNETRS